MDVNGEIRAAAVQSMLRTLRESLRLDSETLVGHSVVSSVGTDIDVFSLGILAFGVPCARA